MQEQVCCQCGSPSKLSNLYGYAFCKRCESELRLHSDRTILKNAKSYNETNSVSYEDEVVRRLSSMEKNFAKARVKLLHILERLTELT